MWVFKHHKYQDILNTWVELKPGKGRGKFKEMAEFLRVSPVFVSQVVNGTRSLTEDQAYLLTGFLELTAQEAEYFILLVQKERASHHAYGKYIDSKISKITKEAQSTRARIKATDLELSKENLAVYFTDPKYTVVHLGSTLKGVKNIDDLTKVLQMKRQDVIACMDFLISCNLVVEGPNGFDLGPTRIHLPKESPFFKTRNMQWRFEAIKSIEQLREDNLCFTGVMSLTEEDSAWVKTRLLDLIAEVSERVSKSKAQTIQCLNLDWFKLPTN
jgi:plasmid maintenance system antidote protein VapI